MKLRLTIQSGSLNGRRYELAAGFLTVGRGENCAVRLDPQTERIASKQHAYLETKSDGFYVIDNQSSNGTYLNNQKVQIAKLNSGDRIQFGKNGVEAMVIIEASESNSEPTVQKSSFAPPSNVRSQYNGQATAVLPPSPQNWRNSMTGISTNHLEEPTAAGQTGKYIGIGIAIFGAVFLSLIVILLTVASVGIGAAIIAAFVAFLPAIFYILPLIWLDRYDPEPLWLLASAFAWGALVAVVVSFIVNTILGAFLGDTFGAVVSAPIFEEGSKGLGLIVLLVFFRRYFDDILDGIVFAGVIALGFATVENVLYYGRGIAEGGSDGLRGLFVLRGIMSPFAHVTFTAMTGIACGIARESHKIFVSLLLPLVGYVCAVALHMLWNGMAVFSGKFLRLFGFDAVCPYIGFGDREIGLCGFFIGYIILQVPLFLIFVAFTFYTMRRQNKILKEMLAIDVVRGLIPQKHLDISTSAFRSSFWVLGSLFNGKFKARNRYIRAIGKLGLTYWHIQRATAAQGHTGSFQQNPILREEVLKWRDQV